MSRLVVKADLENSSTKLFVYFAVQAEVFEDHLVLGESARLVGEQVLDLSEVFAQVGRVHLGRLICFLVIHSKNIQCHRLIKFFLLYSTRSHLDSTHSKSHSKKREPNKRANSESKDKFN